MAQPLNQTPKRILITAYPFNSPVGGSLRQELNDELDTMYPDWESLPHPNIMPRVPPVSDGSLVPKVNTDEGVQSPSSPQRALDALDAKIDLKADESKPIPSAVATQNATSGPTPEQIQKPYFFVAFDVTNTDLDLAKYTPISPLSDPPSYSPPGIPIGCIALRSLPYFPSHRATPDVSPRDPVPAPTLAEVKSMYVARSHRGLQHAVFTTPYDVDMAVMRTNVSEMLIRTMVEFASRELRLSKLVLETGVRQRAAVKLYERVGWKQRPVFGDYVGASEEDGGISRCYELVL